MKPECASVGRLPNVWCLQFVLSANSTSEYRCD